MWIFSGILIIQFYYFIYIIIVVLHKYADEFII